jgi:histidinol phosphatase-like enzyme (inositol monophosphatase family)
MTTTQLPPAEINLRLELVREIVRETGQLVLGYFRGTGLVVERKGDDSPVTIADRRAEEYLRQRIAAAFPEDGILGEEFGEQAGSSGFRWILDPIDGTKAFVRGVPLWGILIGVEHQGETIIGAIHMPALKECVFAARGAGAWYFHEDCQEGQLLPARVSACRRLEESLFVTSDVVNFARAGRPDAYQSLEAAVRLARSWGDCYGYLLVATGRAEVMVDPIVAPWDLAAVMPVIEEAGGKFSDWQGRRTIHAGQAVATNTLVHEEALAILRGPHP